MKYTITITDIKTGKTSYKKISKKEVDNMNINAFYNSYSSVIEWLKLHRPKTLEKAINQSKKKTEVYFR